MVDTMSKRRTHYDVLGLTPAATSAEIEQAFARQFGCFQPHTVSKLADVTVAYEALRNPARRRAYDASLGLKREEAPAQQAPVRWRIGGQVMTATATPAMRPVGERPVVEPQVEPDPVPPAKPEAAPFIAAPFAARLEELANSEPLAERLEARARPQELRREEERRVTLTLDDGAGNAEEAGIPWKQTGVVLGGIAAAVALLGAWAGWESVGSAEPAEAAAKAVLPPPTTYTVSDPAAAATANPVLDVVRTAPARRPAHAATRTARVQPTSRLAELERGLTTPEPAPVEAEAAATAPTETPPSAVAANLPLPSRVIARTIERIGYPCGQIASTSQSEGAGVFKVTCTSGHSYQASPVHGRYRFRRL